MKTNEADSIQDHVYQTVRQWLTVGRYLPGDRLKIKTIADELGVSQMPVRAALQRLAAEHAVVNIPNCGMTVPALNKAQFEDVLQVRMMLEGQAAELGAHRISETERATLVSLCVEMGKALETLDAKAYLDANELFHLILYKASGSPLLLELIETVWLQVGPISNRLFEDPKFAKGLNDAHAEVMTALKQNYPAGVKRAIERDIFYAAQYLKSICQ
ncbi:GntR family transcriptional regulator [Leeia sp. TBRC 13508]|uniref:GntR family transcriptional regulator n=1 Tax=Leeia speluncae TaxID=2884804 RepID=A0ABS8D8R8_9NEIS|nr:GntR family transcriptional regulator [Leeia speluncae]MCB6184599.1 GntR family transcriptional regulator [Leeia speluncae]